MDKNPHLRHPSAHTVSPVPPTHDYYRFPSSPSPSIPLLYNLMVYSGPPPPSLPPAEPQRAHRNKSARSPPPTWFVAHREFVHRGSRSLGNHYSANAFHRSITPKRNVAVIFLFFPSLLFPPSFTPLFCSLFPPARNHHPSCLSFSFRAIIFFSGFRLPALAFPHVHGRRAWLHRST